MMKLPVLSAVSLTPKFSERIGTANIGLKLSGATNGDVVVAYTTSVEGTDSATATNDFTSASSTITISSPNSTGFIPIAINNDTTTGESEETFTVTITSVTGAEFAVGTTNIVITVTIVDDEGLSTLTVDNTSVNVNEGDGNASIGFTLSSAISSGPVTVTYSTTAGTASDVDSDYTIQTDETQMITSGTTGSISIPIYDDNILESSETFTVTITEVTGAAFCSWSE